MKQYRKVHHELEEEELQNQMQQRWDNEQALANVSLTPDAANPFNDFSTSRIDALPSTNKMYKSTVG